MIGDGDDENGDTSWSQYRRLVISEFKRLNDTIERLETKHSDELGRLETKIDILRFDFSKLNMELATVKVKMALIGMVAGVIVSTVVNFFIKAWIK